MCRDDGGGIDAFILNAPCAFNMLRNGPFWTLEWAVLDVSWGRFGLVFSSIGAVLVGAVLVCVGRFGNGPFWSDPDRCRNKKHYI